MGSSGAYASSPDKILKCGAVWCVLKYLLIRLCIEKFPKNLSIFI